MKNKSVLKIDKYINTKEVNEMPEFPKTVKELFEKTIPDNINRDLEKAKGLNAVYQFDITGAEAGTWVVNATPAKQGVSSGPSPDAKCTITVTDKDILDIVSGKLNPQMAFMSGKLKIKGDMGLALKLQNVLKAS
ncbi:MAG: SCP2 sterol-binding domain-containing protein [Deltaproteobacteria bacterium]|nr:SCP2 sterol-binding domain-containing protein [Deltaproteobacteria bacterium]